MNKTEFDNIIKKNLVEKYGEDKFGYIIEDKPYDNYYCNEEFQIFKNEMEHKEEYSKYYNCYYAGAGSELIEKKSRYGLVPPKMASVASSSRFCYLALRDGATIDLIGGNKVQFEYECEISDITSKTYPQLDAFIEDSNTFIEAKCHEIFDPHQIVMSKKYIEYLSRDFEIDLEGMIKEEKIIIPLSEFGINKNFSRFDIKQLLCHLIGISSKKKKLDIDNVNLTYLFFKPKTSDEIINQQIDMIFDDLAGEINQIFTNEHICKFTSKHNITLKAIAEYSEIMESVTKSEIIKLERKDWANGI